MSTLNMFLLLGVGQGLFLVTSIPLMRNPYRAANSVLTLIVLFATLILIGKVFIYSIQNEWFLRFASFGEITLLLLGPLIFFYVRRLLPNNTETYQGWWHFIPAFLFMTYFTWTMTLSWQELRVLHEAGKLNFILFSVETTGLISLIIYWFRSVVAVKKNKVEKNLYSKTYSISVSQYLVFFLGSIGFLILCWTVSFATTYFLRITIPYVTYQSVWIATPIFLYVVGYFSLHRQDILRIPSQFRLTPQRLDSNEANRLEEKLELQISEEHIYKRTDLTLKSLAEAIETTPNNLSWLLNNVHQKSFYDYINQERIKAFQSKIAKEEHRQKTLLALAMDVGFNSKSTFNKAFKTFVGSTPSRYVRERKAI